MGTAISCCCGCPGDADRHNAGAEAGRPVAPLAETKNELGKTPIDVDRAAPEERHVGSHQLQDTDSCHAEFFWSRLSWWHSSTLLLLLTLSLRAMNSMDLVMCVTVSVLLGIWTMLFMRSKQKLTRGQDGKARMQLCNLEGFQLPAEAGIVSAETWKAETLKSGSPSRGAYMLPLECAPLSREQEFLYVAIQNSVAGMTFGDLKRDVNRSIWLVPPNRPSGRSRDVVKFDPKDIVRVVNAVLACKDPSPAETGSQWLQHKYGFRIDHAMDLPKMRLEISPDEVSKCRSVYPKAVYGLAKPYGYPIVWDMVSALRLKNLKDAFGSVDAALERILWYDLYLLELYERHKLRLSARRGGLLIQKGITILDLGAWSSDLLNPGILRTVLQIISRSALMWPESLWRIYLVNVPLVFMGPWAVIKRACHPVTLAKLRIFSNQDAFFRHIDEELGISIDQVPREHGGRGPSLVDLPITPTAHLEQADR